MPAPTNPVPGKDGGAVASPPAPGTPAQDAAPSGATSTASSTASIPGDNRLAALAVGSIGLPVQGTTGGTSSDPVSTISAITALSPSSAANPVVAATGLAGTPSAVSPPANPVTSLPLLPVQLPDPGTVALAGVGQPSSGLTHILPASIPEPSAVYLVFLAIFGLASRRRRRPQGSVR